MRHLLTAAFVVGSLSTCAAPIDPEPGDGQWEAIRVCDPQAIAGLEQLEISVDPPALPQDRVVFDAVLPTSVPGYPCDCGDPRCLSDWIDQHLGCGVCAHVRCDGGMAGACVPCGTIIDEPPCFLPPANQNAPI